jgi:hypothetical protein
MVNALYNERYQALQNIAFHPQSERWVDVADERGGFWTRDWMWEAQSMRDIALAALKVEEES